MSRPNSVHKRPLISSTERLCFSMVAGSREQDGGGRLKVPMGAVWCQAMEQNCLSFREFRQMTGSFNSPRYKC